MKHHLQVLSIVTAVVAGMLVWVGAKLPQLLRSGQDRSQQPLPLRQRRAFFG